MTANEIKILAVGVCLTPAIVFTAVFIVNLAIISSGEYKPVNQSNVLTSLVAALLCWGGVIALLSI